MAMVINSNIASLNAQRHLSESRADMETSMERLASGERINSAVDDAAGGAIASRMETRVSGMEQLIRNINDGVSMVQIAESAMGEVNDMLQRMRDLAVQSTNSTLNFSDRQTLQLEVDQLIEEINTIAATTQFNGQNILTGEGAINNIQTGLNAGESVSFTVGGVSATKLGLSSGASGQEYSGRVASATVDTAGDIMINGVDIDAYTHSAGNTAGDLADHLNLQSSVTGVTATAYNRVEGKVVGLGELSIDEIYVGTTDGASTNAVSVGASFSSLTALAAAINEKAPGVTAEVSSEGRIILSNTTGADIVLDGAGLAAAGFEPDPNTATDDQSTASTYNKYAGFIKFENNDGSSNPISFEIDADVGTAADLKVFGLNVKTAEGVVSGGTVTDGASITANQAITINGVSIGAIDTDTAAAYMEAINAVTAETGVTATALTEFFIKANDDAGSAGEYAFDLSTGSTAGDGTEFSINGIDVAVAATGNSEALVTAINTAVNSVGIYAEGKADGTIRIYTQNGGDLEFSGSSFNGGTALENATAIKGKLSLTSANDELISISSLATTDADRAAAVAKSGLVYTNDYDADGAGLNVSTASAASSALATLDEAITLLSNNRAEMGAYLKRFEAETSNLQVSIEKTASALSAIMDADYAVESANLAKAQVLQQAGTAMLAQANASTQNVLSLLK